MVENREDWKEEQEGLSEKELAKWKRRQAQEKAPKTVSEIIVRSLSDRFFLRRGRASRKEYWTLIAFQFVLLYVMKFLIQGVPVERAGQGIVSVLMGADYVMAVVLFVMTACATVRRLHDVNANGWFAWIYVLSFAFPPLGVLLLMPYTLRRSVPGTNRHGVCPVE